MAWQRHIAAGELLPSPPRPQQLAGGHTRADCEERNAVEKTRQGRRRKDSGCLFVVGAGGRTQLGTLPFATMAEL